MHLNRLKSQSLRSLLRSLVQFARWPLLAGLVVVASANEGSRSNKEQVAAAFEAWALNQGSPFELLDAEATWTILGPTATAGTYSIPRLREEILLPFQAKLATPLVPELRALYEDGDTVIALFEASARLKSGEDYANSYAWFFHFEGGRVSSLVAVLDLTVFDRVLQEGE